MKTRGFKKFQCAFIAAVLAVFFGVCGCDNNRKYYDNENDAMVLSTLDVDGVFNPFFSTSGTDSTIVGMTQIGMLGNDKDGGYTYGDEENVVVKDLQIIEYDDAGNEIDPDKYTDKDEAVKKPATAKSKYLFVLKNDVVFSDGSPLTMKDVLFNLYVYLDNFYTGASTIYSTDIIGLKEYRTGESNENEQDAFMAQFKVLAGGRIKNLLSAINAIKNENKNTVIDDSEQLRGLLEDYLEKATNKETYGNIVVDYDKAISLFKEELETDWSNSIDSYEDTTFKNAKGDVIKPFTTDVEVFLYNENMITWNKNANGGVGELTSSLENDVTKLKNYTKETAIKAVFDRHIPDNIDEVLQYWMTAAELQDYLEKDELEKYLKTNADKNEYKNISGIKFANRTESVTVNGKAYAAPTYYTDGEKNAHANNPAVKSGNEVLSIEINKVDPKAIWNFAFSVAPMYYYSNEAQMKLADYETHFGLESSQTFMQNVINDPDKSGVPVGAGPYMAATATDDTKNVTRGTFHANSMIYFVRNEHYIGGVPKIRKLRYSIVSSSNTMTMLQGGNVDFAEPNAKQEIIDQLKGMKNKGYSYKQITTAGYGYIGINAGKVPDIKIRQAIMHAINTQECVNYYKTGATAIYRSMSLSNWAYPKDCTPYYPYIGAAIPSDWSTVNVNPDYKSFVQKKGKKAGDTFTVAEQKEFLLGLVKGAGYNGAAGDTFTKGNNILKYTFTIAGDETDHPAYSALLHASELLNDVGFDIDVKPDSQALKKLASGSLTVWAAAWGSTIDPDMYQVYHKDSNASSVKNWGYPQILMNAGGKYDYELGLLDLLAKDIEDAREVNDQNERAKIYARALTKVMQLAVELPTYQRDDLFAYNSNKIDDSTFTPEKMRSPYRGLMYDIHNVSLVVAK